MTHDPDAAERLAKDCNLAAQCLRDTGTFRSGQGVLDDAAALIRAQAAEIARLKGLDTPAPPTPAEPAGDALREAAQALVDYDLTEGLMDCIDRERDPYRSQHLAGLMGALATALASAPAPIQPAPQPDEDERERLLAALATISEDRVPPVEPLHRDRCVHGRNMDEDCKHCVVAFARAALASEPRA